MLNYITIQNEFLMVILIYSIRIYVWVWVHDLTEMKFWIIHVFFFLRNRILRTLEPVIKTLVLGMTACNYLSTEKNIVPDSSHMCILNRTIRYANRKQHIIRQCTGLPRHLCISVLDIV